MGISRLSLFESRRSSEGQQLVFCPRRLQQVELKESCIKIFHKNPDLGWAQGPQQAAESGVCMKREKAIWLKGTR